MEISPFFDLIECFCRKNYTDDLTNEEPNHWINLIYASQLSEIISLSNKYSTPQRALTNNFSYLTEAKREQLIDSALGEMLFSSIYHTKNDVYSVQKTLNSMHEIMTRMSFYKPINETLDKLHSLIKYEKNPDDIEKTIKNIYRFKSEFIFPWLEKILPKESHQSNEFFFYYSEAYKRLHEIYYYLNHIIENKNYFSAQDIIESLNQKLELIHQKTPFTKGIQSKQFEKILAEITSLLIAPTPSAPSMTNHLTSCILFFGRSKNINYPSRSSITPNDDSPQEITPLIC